ncbi:MAG: tRNA (adenosine(37)-N6)-dimethylallyltransferase MiaA [Spirochaetia bacterium]
MLFGPTAVGKSELLLSLLDSRFEVISADSLQVYRHMEVGTAKPSAADRASIPYHLVDVADPSEQFSAGRFVTEAEALVPAVWGRGRIPLIAGGTAFYITSLLYGLPEAPPVDSMTRERLRLMERQQGREALYRMLEERDPQAAARIQRNDRYRVMRALEVIQTTGRSLFSFRWPRSPRTDMRFLVIGLERPREEVYRRIDARVRAMFAAGLVDEVKGLLAMGYGPSDPGMRGIGYRELLDMRVGCETLAEVRDRIARDTRRYAKRQLTFFRRVPDVVWMNPDQPSAVRARIEAFIACASLA